MAASNYNEASAQCKRAIDALQIKLSSNYDVVKPKDLEDLANAYTSAQPPKTEKSLPAGSLKSVPVKKCGATVAKYFGKNRRKVEISSSYTAYKNVLVSEGTGNYTISSSGSIREETTNTHFEKQENGTKNTTAYTELIFFKKNSLHKSLPAMVFFSAHANDFFAAKSVKYGTRTLSAGCFIFFKILLLLTFIGFASFCSYQIYNTALYLQNKADYIVELAWGRTTMIYTALLAINLVLTIITCNIYYNKIELSRNSNIGHNYCYFAKHIIVIFVLQCFAFGMSILAGECGLYTFFHSTSDATVSFLQILSLLLFPALGVIAIYTLIFIIFVFCEWNILSAKRIEKLKTKYTDEEIQYLDSLYDELCENNLYIDPFKLERELSSLLDSNMNAHIY